jgi:hypothetical protein
MWVSATEDTGELATVLAAGSTLDVGPEALERVGLVRIAGLELQFRHPLVRSATYDGATFTARLAAHRALTTILDRDRQADRRAWHLAAAALEQGVQAAVASRTSPSRRAASPPSATSTRTARPRSPSSSAVPAAAASVRSTQTTLAPSVASRVAMAAPSPEPAPVTTATRSSNLPMASPAPTVGGQATDGLVARQRRAKNQLAAAAISSWKRASASTAPS